MSQEAEVEITKEMIVIGLAEIDARVWMAENLFQGWVDKESPAGYAVLNALAISLHGSKPPKSDTIPSLVNIIRNYLKQEDYRMEGVSIAQINGLHRLLVDNVFDVHQMLKRHNAVPMDSNCGYLSALEASQIEGEDKILVMQKYWSIIEAFTAPSAAYILWLLSVPDDDNWEVDCQAIYNGLTGLDADPKTAGLECRKFLERKLGERYLWSEDRLNERGNRVWLQVLAVRTCGLALEDYEEHEAWADLARDVALHMQSTYKLSVADALLLNSMSDAQAAYSVVQCSVLFGKVLGNEVFEIVSCILSMFYYQNDRSHDLLRALACVTIGNVPRSTKDLKRLKAPTARVTVATALKLPGGASNARMTTAQACDWIKTLGKSYKKGGVKRDRAESEAESIETATSSVGGNDREPEGRGLDAETAAEVHAMSKKVRATGKKTTAAPADDLVLPGAKQRVGGAKKKTTTVTQERNPVTAPVEKLPHADLFGPSTPEDNGSDVIHPAGGDLFAGPVDHPLLVGVTTAISTLFGNPRHVTTPAATSLAARMVGLYTPMYRRPFKDDLMMLCRGAEGWLPIALGSSSDDPWTRIHLLEQVLFRVVESYPDFLEVRAVMMVGSACPETRLDLQWPASTETCTVIFPAESPVFLTPILRCLAAYNKIRPPDHIVHTVPSSDIEKSGRWVAPTLTPVTSAPPTELRPLSTVQTIAPLMILARPDTTSSAGTVSSLSHTVVSQSLQPLDPHVALARADAAVSALVSGVHTPLRSPAPPNRGTGDLLPVLVQENVSHAAVVSNLVRPLMSMPDQFNQSYQLSSKPEQERAIRRAATMRQLCGVVRCEYITGTPSGQLIASNYDGQHMLECALEVAYQELKPGRTAEVQKLAIYVRRDYNIIQLAFFLEFTIMDRQGEGDCVLIDHFLRPDSAGNFRKVDSPTKLVEALEGLTIWFRFVIGWTETFINVIRDLRAGGVYGLFTIRYFLSELYRTLAEIRARARRVTVLTQHTPKEYFDIFLESLIFMRDGMSCDKQAEFYQTTSSTINGRGLDRFLGDGEEPVPVKAPPPAPQAKEERRDRRSPDQRPVQTSGRHDRSRSRDRDRGRGGGRKENLAHAGQYCFQNFKWKMGMGGRNCDRKEVKDGFTCGRVHWDQVPEGTSAASVRKQALGCMSTAEVSKMMSGVIRDRHIIDDVSDHK